MPVNICVLAKQVVDPEMPAAAFRIDPDARQVVPPANIPPVVNGFDENAVEAALQIKDEQGANITVISSGTTFALDVMKKPLSMGADELVLLAGRRLRQLGGLVLHRAVAHRRHQQAGRLST